jgi:hypothetical protein
MGHAICLAEMRNSYKIFVGKPKGKRLLERPRQRKEDGFGEIDWKGVN